MENLYTKRKVADKDSQSCLVCYTPTATVLYNASIQDWFYCCEIHVDDNPSFAKPIYPEEYTDVLEKIKVTKQKLDVEKSRGTTGSWDSWVNKVMYRRNSDKRVSESGNNTNGADNIGEDKTSTGETPNSKNKPPSELASLTHEYQLLLDQVSRHRNSIRNYSLSQVMFESRLDAKKRKYMRQRKAKQEAEAYTNTDPEELQTKFSFPSVPQQ
ncbi:LADA_0G03862g1_1 [Lachancea dasiensis]|uniref:LADA_0G03862g1_1 n=1 Tax=Lachancea dasiensis TaxID=1072105 RepID=A0A1G4JRX9_9SACH|nr:LADA_0G03862g1_1 [Lachancea dasiensis]